MTIGGGQILDTHPIRHRPRQAKTLEGLRLLWEGDATQRLEEVLRSSPVRPFSLSSLILAAGMDRETLLVHLQALIQEGKVIAWKEREEVYLHFQTFDRIREQILRQLSLFHQHETLKEGMMQEDLRGRLVPPPEMALFQKVIGRRREEGGSAAEKGRIRLASHRPRLGEEEEKTKSALERTYREAGLQPPSLPDVLQKMGKDPKRTSDLVRLLMDEGILIRVKGDLLFHRESHEKAKEMLVGRLGQDPTLSVAQFKELLGISRKWAIPLLEHFDEIKLTRRVGDDRVLFG
jgi:selenocysteine-specific elongation factor